MAKFVLILLSLVLLETGWALKCKECKDAKCSTLEDKTCPASPANMEAACLIHIYKENKDAKEEMTEKKCVNRQKGSKYDCIKIHPQTEVEVKCDTCVEDFCNEKSGASTITLGSLAVVSLIATVATKFL